MARKYNQGRYFPKNPQKYRGDVHNILFRSGWEYHFLRYCDLNPNVLEYSSEEVIIPYFSDIDQKMHRYFVDFLIKIKTASGEIKTILIEIKPHSQIIKPLVEGKINKRNEEKIKTWIINQCKWKAAKLYANQRGWEFRVMSEKDLGIKT